MVKLPYDQEHPTQPPEKRITRQKCKMLDFFSRWQKISLYFLSRLLCPCGQNLHYNCPKQSRRAQRPFNKFEKETIPYSHMAKRYTNKRDKQYIPHDGLPRFLSWGAESHKSRHSHKAPRVLTQLTAHCLHHRKSKKS